VCLRTGPKADSTATGTPALAVGEPPSQGVELGEEDVELLVMFGTEYGFSKEVADKVAAELSTAPYRFCYTLTCYIATTAVWLKPHITWVFAHRCRTSAAVACGDYSPRHIITSTRH
jgi:hypothetical protein